MACPMECRGMPVRNRLGVTLKSEGEDTCSVIASVNGFEGGWVVAMAGRWESSKPPQLIACPNFTSVLKETESCKVVVVDIPIGLPSGAESRTCDMEARIALGKSRQSRLFLCPPRQRRETNTPQEFQKRIKELTGKGAGWPVWGIVGKIKEVDDAMTPDLQNRIMEFHPDLAWKRLAGSVLASKHGAEGLLHRINILNKHEASWLAELKTGRLAGKVKLDDVLDSIVGLSVAHAVAEDPGYKNKFPQSDSPKDEPGLRMEIWF